MKLFSIAALLLAAAGAAWAQTWEFGVGAGEGIARSIQVTSGSGTANTGFAPGAAFAVFLGNSDHKHVGGELRYVYRMGDLRIRSGGEEARFSGQTHAVHYDLIFHTNNKAKAQLFLAIGGGMKIYRGTGAESAYQPLMQYAYLTKTQTTKGMGDVGFGFKAHLSKKILFRAEVRDYITKFPTEVITPAIGASFHGSVLHDILPTAGLSYAF